MARVATSHPSDQTYNTLVLDGINLIIPLEIDLDNDPDTPDMVRLKSDDGGYEAILTAGQEGVEQDGDNPLNYFHFHYVPLGVFSIAVKIADQWCTIVASLRVTHTGVFVGDVNFEAQTDGSELGTPEDYPVQDLIPEPEIRHECEA